MSFFRNRQSSDEKHEERTPQPTISVSQNPIGFETVVGTGCTIEGKLINNGNIRIDGTFTGTLEITGNVLVGETAQIKADINAKNISIAGSVRGNVSGKKVQLLRTGRVWGDISATALTTEEGAFIDGKISMMSDQPQDSGLDEPDFIDTVEVPEVDDDDEDDETAFIPRSVAKDAMDKVEELRREQEAETLIDSLADDDADEPESADNKDDA